MSIMRIAQCFECGLRYKISLEGVAPNCRGKKMKILGFVKDESLKVREGQKEEDWMYDLMDEDFEQKDIKLVEEEYFKNYNKEE